jgi:Ca2+-binding RTX toxin-like protein
MNTNDALIRVIAVATLAVPTVLTAETILGTAGPDYLIGTPGADFINGRGGADKMTGLAGNDTYVVNVEADKVVEQAGDGTDTVRVFGWYVLPAHVENLVVAGSRNGGGYGNRRANRMIGNSAFNQLDGGPGNDTLTGHGGPDHFSFDSPLDARTNVDRVTDFNVEEDVITLGERFPALFSYCEWGFPLYPWLFHVGAAATTPLHFIVYNPASGGVFYDSDGSGPTPAVRFATLSPNLALTSSDFGTLHCRN